MTAIKQFLYLTTETDAVVYLHTKSILGRDKLKKMTYQKKQLNLSILHLFFGSELAVGL